MATNPFATLPPNASPSAIKPFVLDYPDSEIKSMKDLLKLTPVASAIYENSTTTDSRNLGMKRDWLLQAKEYWEGGYDWKKQEKLINSFPQFKAQVSDPLGDFSIYFTALFSKRQDAIPILLLHGWPGSFMEFLPMLSLLRDQYTPETLPYHFVVPSLPAYGLSSLAPVDRDLTLDDAASILNGLADVLGFSKYVVQGGDVGSRVARIMGVKFDNCKAVHLNLCAMLNEPKNLPKDIQISAIEKESFKRFETWKASGQAYAMEHGTRPGTIGFVLASNPLAILAWVGEKFLEWTDANPPLEEILNSVTLYWLSKTAHSSLWSYRNVYGPNPKHHDSPEWFVKKPFGYSFFPKELIPVPVAWAATTGNLVFSKVHDSGGHFAAMEKPKELLADLIEFVEIVKKDF